jgi:hypothetical protein
MRIGRAILALAACALVFAAAAIEPPQPPAGAPAPAKPESPAAEAPPPAGQDDEKEDEKEDAKEDEEEEELPPLPPDTVPTGPPPQRFDPSEKVRADFPVSFPIDI